MSSSSSDSSNVVGATGKENQQQASNSNIAGDVTGKSIDSTSCTKKEAIAASTATKGTAAVLPTSSRRVGGSHPLKMWKAAASKAFKAPPQPNVKEEPGVATTFSSSATSSGTTSTDNSISGNKRPSQQDETTMDEEPARKRITIVSRAWERGTKQ